MLIYKATDIENKKVYIGATTKSLEERKNGHIKDSKRDGRNHYRFAAALNDRENKFTWEVLEYCNTEDDMWKLEDYYIQLYESTNPDKGYNMNGGGKSGKKSQETKDKIGTIGKLQWNTGNCAKDKIEAGRQRAIKVWKQKCKEMRIEFICPVCGKKLLLTRSEYQKRTYCSVECSNADRNNEVGITNANIVNNILYKKKCDTVKSIIILWKYKYKNDIINCKMNNTTIVLKPLCDACEKLVGIKDIRSIIKCYVGKYIYRKNFINIIKESY